MAASSSEWVQMYQQAMDAGQPNPVPSFGFSDPKIVTRSYQLSPKGTTNYNSVSKPIRKRSSRASKRTSTTLLLNANPANFQALVQKFTGCPSKSFGFESNPKGPVTLNFEQNHCNDQYYQQSHDHQLMQQKEAEQQQLLLNLQEQQCMFSYDDIVPNNDDFVWSSSRARASMEDNTANGFAMEDIYFPS